MLKFDKAKLGDIDQIYSIYMHPTVNSYMGFPVISKSKFLPLFKKFYKDIMLWKKDYKIIALVAIQKSEYRRSHAVLLSKLAIIPELQNQGLGKVFLESIFLKLKKEKIKRIELIVESDNLKAIKFYKKIGFKIEGTMKKYFHREGKYIDDYLMALLY